MGMRVGIGVGVWGQDEGRDGDGMGWELGWRQRGLDGIGMGVQMGRGWDGDEGWNGGWDGMGMRIRMGWGWRQNGDGMGWDADQDPGVG